MNRKKMEISGKISSVRPMDTGFSYIPISERTEVETFLQKGKPIARWGRKATGSLRGTAWLLKGVCDEPKKYSSQ